MNTFVRQAKFQLKVWQILHCCKENFPHNLMLQFYKSTKVLKFIINTTDLFFSRLLKFNRLTEHIYKLNIKNKAHLDQAYQLVHTNTLI